MLTMSRSVHLAMVAHALAGLPLEACGLFAGDPRTGAVDVFYPCGNDAASAKLYTVNPRDHLRADRDADDRGLELIGVMHSHTHTEAWPSPTDVRQAVDPSWHYVIVSLKRPEPVLRSYRLVGGGIHEERVVIVGGG